jgi:uncharacterized repeat protein (TIGR03803 family)
LEILFQERGGNSPGGGGLVYQLVPQGGSWSFVPLYALFDPGGDPGPAASLTMDAAGNLYGTTQYGGQDELGTVFKLTHKLQLWTYTLLHEFTGGSDGGLPGSRVVLDAQGNVYGTTLGGGAFEQGVAFKIEQ